MAQAKDLEWRDITNPALPFDSTNSVTHKEPIYIAGSNVLTSIREIVERRPGFPTALTTDTFPGETIKRIFTWRLWGGAFFIMVSTTGASNSRVYKYQVGTDTVFGLVYDDLTTSPPTPFDFEVANNACFFANGGQTWKYNGSGVSTSPWGIGTTGMFASPQTNGIPTTTLGTTGISAVNGGYQYVYTYGNPTSGHESDASRPSVSTGNFTNKAVTITGMKSSDTQVTAIHVYRTTDGGGGTYFEISGSPLTVGAPFSGTWTLTDTTTDANLATNSAPASFYPGQISTNVGGINTDPLAFGTSPNRIKAITWWNNRIWGCRNNELRFSGWEEVTVGVEEECFPDDNFYKFAEETVTSKPTQAGLLVFGASNVYRITGDSLDTFARIKLFSRMGTRSPVNVAAYGGLVAWLDTANVVRLSDGYSQEDISAAVRASFGLIDPTRSSVAFHIYGTNHWLIVSDFAAGKLYVYDLDTKQWMPPWAITCSAIHSGETSVGFNDFIVATSNRIVKMSTSTYTDLGTAYTASLTTNALDLVPEATNRHPAMPGTVGELEYVLVDRNSVALSGVGRLTDDDPSTQAFTSIFANEVNPPMRTAGTDLVEKWYYSRSPASRRVAVKLDWAAANSNFKLYSFALGYKRLT